MTDLSTPIWIIRDDAKNIRVRAENITDHPAEKAEMLRRADQCDLAARILELYVEQSRGQRSDRMPAGPDV